MIKKIIPTKSSHGCSWNFPLLKLLNSYPYSGVVGSVVVVVVGRLVVVVVVARIKIRPILNFSVPFKECSTSFKVDRSPR